MNPKLPLNKVMNKAYLTIFIPMYLYTPLSLMVGFYFADFHDDASVFSWMIVVFLLIFILPILHWIIFINKWRVWAFENVENVHRLKRRAEREWLILGKKNLLTKLEYFSSSDKTRWKNLQIRFEQDPTPTIEDGLDLSWPPQLTLYNHKIKIILWLLFIVPCGIFMFKDFINEWDNLSWYYIILYGVWQIAIIGVTVYYSKKIMNNNPQLILNNLGIKSDKFGFRSWANISDEKVIKRGKRSYHLVYITQGKKEEIDINDLTMGHYKISKALETYRSRYEKDKK